MWHEHMPVSARAKRIIRGVAAERIAMLHAIAVETMPNDGARARVYVKLIKRIGSHYKVALPQRVKRSLCKRCDAVLLPGIGAKVRIASVNRQVIYACAACGTERRIRY